MSVRHLISMAGLGSGDVRRIVERGAWYGSGHHRCDRPLSGRTVGVYFRRTSTRTRTAFSRAAQLLGADIIAYGPADLQENTGESVADTTRVLSGMLDALVARTAGSDAEMRAFAAQDRMAVINAMSAGEHPTQALADLATIHRRFGSVDGLRLTYIGEGNNTAAALALALAHYGSVELHLRTPPGYGLDPAVLAAARRGIEARGGFLAVEHDMTTPMKPCDIVYTTRWQTTGTTKPDPDWRDVFAPFRVTAEVMAAHPQGIFMHDLPAHRGEEVDAEVLDGSDSIAFEQAEGKLAGALAVLEWCLLGPDR
ncbi:ornithine carbamoyltransferase [Nonomuraea sp. NPDC049141]|uniref:ornithine carbamoyltransferase n=1 Tax=Nonomuraea sp. NPDC049141 TaxID=3155500 RepID=UPI00340B7EAA